MNKKVLTLVAGMFLATTVGAGSLYAQNGTISNFPSNEIVASIESGKFYQLSNGGEVLVMEKTTTGTFVLKFVPFHQAELAKSLWEVRYIKNNNENGYAFQFVNLTTGLPISFDPEHAYDVNKPANWKVSELSEGVNHWAWRSGIAGAALLPTEALEAHYGDDMVMTLVKTTDGTGNVVAVKYSTKDYAHLSSALKFTVKIANPVYLNAYDLNTMLQSRDIKDGLTLTFNEEPLSAELPNEFTGRSYEVHDAISDNTLSKGSVDDARQAMYAAQADLQVKGEAYTKSLTELAIADATLENATDRLNEIAKERAEIADKTIEQQGIRAAAQENLKGYSAEQGSLWQQIADLTDNETLQEQLNSAQSKLDEATAEYEKWQNVKEEYCQDLADAETDVNNFVEAVGSVSIEGELKERYDALIKAMQDAAQALDDYVKNESIYQQQVDDAQKTVDSILAEIADSNELLNRYNYLTEQIEKAETEIRNANAIITANIIADAKLQVEDEECQEIIRNANGNIELRNRYYETKMAWKQAEKAYELAANYFNSIRYMMEYDWYSLYSNEDQKYLMVDTAYMESSAIVGDKHQKFALNKYEDATQKYAGIDLWNARDINGRFNFRFLYYPTVDSLVISADGGNDKYETVTYWKDRKNYQISPVEGRNIVKLANLGSRQEVTIGAPDWVKGTWEQTLNTRIGLNLVSATPGKDILAGVYFADVVDPETLEAKSRLMLDLNYDFTKVATAEWNVMNFAHMPAAKWVVKENTIYSGSPAIQNQESGWCLNNGAYRVIDVKEDGTTILYLKYYNYQDKISEDLTVKLTPVAEVNDYGYIHKGFSVNTDSIFTLNYLNVTGGLSVQIGAGNDTVLRVAEGEGTRFILENATKDAVKYGVDVEKDNTFEKRAYYIRVNDADKLNNNYKYVNVSNVDGTELLVVSDIKTTPNPTQFYLKEVNDVDSVHYFALISVDNQYKAGIIDASGLIKAENIENETTTSAFALNFDKTAYYRKFTSEELGKDGVLNFYRANTTEKAYLYVDESLLAVENKGDNVGDLSNFTVIPAATEGTIMPQYFIAKDVNVVEGDTIWCNATAAHKHETLADSLACSHTVIIKDTIFGNFLVNFQINDDLREANLWENRYTRLGFLNGYITNDTLFINDNDVKDTVAVAENKHHATKFEFRLVDEGDEQNFLIESESWKDKNAFAGDKRPFEYGGWIKIQNTVPVVVKTGYEDAVASGDLFNVDTNYTPTANEEISAEEATVSVVATDGAVIVKGAEGKNVVVSTILGKVVANEVLNSDNETIAAPAGIVVVSVDGESFKVAVK